MHKGGQRGRGRPPRKRPASGRHSTLSIGNCRVELPTSLPVSVDAGGLCVNVPDAGNINIKVANETPLLPEEFSVTLLNPKLLDATGKLLLEDVLKLYVAELPAMKYAAGTGKESKFLQSCVFDGKYCTMVLRSKEAELVGAITFQILPSEPSAEVPLAAIAQSYHRKGFGSSLYKELQRRLSNVGIVSIFCWGDEESLAFWAKQGFVVVGEVDGRGRARKLPIKAEIHRAMSIPGSATLMISYLSLPSTTIAKFHDHLKTVENSCLGSSLPPMSTSPVFPKEIGQAVGGQKKSPHMNVTTPPAAGECKPHQDTSITPVIVDSTRTSKLSYSSVTPLNMERILSDVASENQVGASKSKSQSQSPSLLKRANDGPASVPAQAALKDITNTATAASEPDGLIRPLKKRRIIETRQAETCKRSNDETSAVIHKSPLSDVTKGAAINASDKNDKPDGPTIAIPNQNGFGGPTLRSRFQLPPSEVQGDLARGGKQAQETNGTPAVPTEVNLSARLRLGIRGRRKHLSEPPIEPPKKIDARLLVVPGGDVGAESPAEPNGSAFSPGDQQQASENFPKRGGNLDESGLPFLESLQPSSLQKSAEQTRIEAAHKSFAPLLEQDSGDLESRMLSGMNLASIPAISGPHLEQAVGEVNPDISQKQAEEQPVPGSAHVKNGDHSSRSEAHVSDGLPLQMMKDDATPAAQLLSKTKPVIMFMNMADENQKKQLTKRVEALQGEVTSDGRQCTHMVLREVRRTRNFCVAISSGAWIVSPDWLKMSVKQNRFADESRFIPRDRKFEVKYKVSLQEVIFRARQRPNALFEGMSFYATPHVQPPLETISSVVKAAGGQVLQSLNEATTAEKKSNVVVVACEEDMSEAIAAAKAGLQTFDADWLLTSVVKQELDFSATQFSMSL